MSRNGLRRSGIAALALTLTCAGSLSATAATAPATGSSATTLDTAHLKTTLAHHVTGPVSQVMEPCEYDTECLTDLAFASPGHIRLDQLGTIWDVTTATGQATPILSSGFIAAQDDPRHHGALDESFVPNDVTVDPAGVTVSGTSDRVMATAPQTTTTYGVTIPGGTAVNLAGGGTSTADGVLATTALVLPQAVATSRTGLLGINARSTDPNDFRSRLRIVPSTSGSYFGQQMEAGKIYSVGYAYSANQIAFDTAGNLISSDESNLHITAVADGTAYGITMTAGRTYTLAPITWGATDVAVDSSGTIVWRDWYNGAMRLYALSATSQSRYGKTLKAGVATRIGSSDNPFTLDDQGTIITESNSMDASGRTTVQLHALAATAGQLYGTSASAGQTITIMSSTSVPRYDNGGPAGALPFQGSHLDVRQGDVVATGSSSTGANELEAASIVIPKQTGTAFGTAMTAGRPYYVLGNGLMPPTFLSAGRIADGAVANSTDVKVTDSVFDLDGNLVAITGDRQQVTVVPRQSGTYYGRQMQAGHAYLLAGKADAVGPPVSEAPAAAASLGQAGSLVVDLQGNVLIGANEGLLVLPASSGTFYGRQMQPGRVYAISAIGYGGRATGDGGPIADAQHLAITHLSRDGVTGNIIVTEGADFRGVNYARIRVLANQSGTFFGVPMTQGNIYTVAGGPQKATKGDDGSPATAAWLPHTVASTLTHDGRLLISSKGKLREVGSDGIIRTVAGRGVGFSPDGTLAGNAYLTPYREYPERQDIDLDGTDHPLLIAADGLRTLR